VLNAMFQEKGTIACWYDNRDKRVLHYKLLNICTIEVS
jgi:hypothetical protein